MCIGALPSWLFLSLGEAKAAASLLCTGVKQWKQKQCCGIVTAFIVRHDIDKVVAKGSTYEAR